MMAIIKWGFWGERLKKILRSKLSFNTIGMNKLMFIKYYSCLNVYLPGQEFPGTVMQF